MANPTIGREEMQSQYYLFFLGTKVKIKATFRYVSFTFKEEVILQTMKEGVLKDKEGRALPLDL